MELAITKHRLQPKHFALSLGVTSLLYAVFSVPVYLIFWIFASDATIREFWQDLSSSSGVWLFPLVGGIMHAFSFQQHTLTITGINEPDKVANWVESFLQKEGREIVSKHAKEMVLASQKKYFRLFNYWLGAELVHIRYTNNCVTISGHYRHVDLVDSKIRFGKPDFSFQKVNTF